MCYIKQAEPSTMQIIFRTLQMDNLTKTVLLCSFLAALLLLGSHPTMAQEVEHESEFDYNEKGKKGPSRWGDILPEWSSCKNGSMQSPIDLLNERVEVISQLGRLKRSYKSSRAILKNRGHDMMLKWKGNAGHIKINGTRYFLKQCHWHSPSEHTIDGRRYALEAHLVHETEDGKTAVFGILYKIGRSDSFLASIAKQLENMENTDEEGAVGKRDPRDIQIGSRKYYRYIGSLTVPPCTENVIWTISRKVRTVTREQVRLLRVAVHDESDTNARPTQRRNSRTVQLYRPADNKND